MNDNDENDREFNRQLDELISNFDIRHAPLGFDSWSVVQKVYWLKVHQYRPFTLVSASKPCADCPDAAVTTAVGAPANPAEFAGYANTATSVLVPHPIDRIRLEGVYVSTQEYPEGGNGIGQLMIRIERVGGNGRVDTIEVTKNEAIRIWWELDSM